jgi:catechol 2,3-dioxygenase-like lactoylglutathione lyase family enzyme
MISGVSKVVLLVDDQQRAKEFWTNRMGFELRRDESCGDERWIEGPGRNPLRAGSMGLSSHLESGRPAGSRASPA